jgi:hypothetical protein
MGRYEKITTAVRHNHGFVPKPCWIADVLASFGLTGGPAHNRRHPDRRLYPCPANKRPAIEMEACRLAIIR